MDDSSSLASSIYGYTYENGRRYHAYREGAYVYPNDAEEQDRLDLLHHIWRLQLHGGLYLAPLDPDIGRVLDLGTGTGIWAIDFADEFVNAEVIGNDLSPIQPGWLPPNCTFYVDDIESEWTYGPEEAFDYIHGRGMCGSIADWPLLHKRALEHLKPGGWFELQEYDTIVTSFDDANLQKCPVITEWQKGVWEASERFGKPLHVARYQKQWMIDAGFEDVHEILFEVPIGTWAKDPHMKELGRFQREQMLGVIAPFTLALFTRVLGWKPDEVQVMMAGVRKEFSDPALRLITTFRYIYGRKPTSAATMTECAPITQVRGVRRSITSPDDLTDP